MINFLLLIFCILWIFWKFWEGVMKCRKFQRTTRISINAAGMRILLICSSGNSYNLKADNVSPLFCFVKVCNYQIINVK